MKSFNYSVFFFTSLFFLVQLGTAQHDYHGCHHHKNKIKHQPLTDHQKLLIQDSNARSDTFDILHYDITIDVTSSFEQYITAVTTIQLTPKMDNVQSVTFDLMNLTVDSVFFEESPIAYTRQGEELTINLSGAVNISDTLELTVHYQGNPYQDPEWGGFYFQSGYIYNLGIGLSTIPPNFGRVWYPCFDSFVERATYTYHVTSTDGKKAYCQGDFLGEDIILGDTVTRHFDFTEPIPTFLSAIAVSNYESFTYDHPGEYSTIPVTLTAKPEDLDVMQSKFEALGEAIDALEYWYGPYNWDRVGYVLTTVGALEIPTNIAYPNNMLESSNIDNGLLFSHELGHQWWGNVVTPQLHNHMWIKEGPAEYSGHLFVEWTQGEEGFIEEVKKNQLFVLEDAHRDDNGFWPLSPIPDEQIYGRHTYYKGASVLHNLRAYLGDSLFRSSLHEIQANSYTSVDAEGFKELLEEASGYDLTSYFNDWIYSPGFSTFVVDSFASVPVGDNYSTTVYFKQLLREAPNFHTNVPIELAAINATWDKEYFSDMVSGEYSQVTIETSYLPEAIKFNPRNKLNGARMDEEVTIYADQNFNSLLPLADIRIKKIEAPDSVLLIVEHIWAGPEVELSDNIDEISNTHYWEISGFFPEGTDLEATINYFGNYEGTLDEDLAGDSEEGIFPVYRENSDSPWEEYPYYQAYQGALTNGTGYFKLFHLKKGQYAFAKGTSEVNVEELNPQAAVVMFPNPVSRLLSFSELPIADVKCIIYDIKGIQVMSQSLKNNQVNVEHLPNGSYTVMLFDDQDSPLFQSLVEVVH